MDGWINKWMDGWIDNWMNGWMDGWIEHTQLEHLLLLPEGKLATSFDWDRGGVR